MARSQTHARPLSQTTNPGPELENLKAKMVEKETEIKNHLADKEQLVQKIQSQAEKINVLTHEQDEKNMKIKNEFWNKVQAFITNQPNKMKRLGNQLEVFVAKRHSKALFYQKDIQDQAQDIRDEDAERNFSFTQIFWWIIVSVTLVLILGVSAWAISDYREREINAWKSRFSDSLEKTKGDN